MTGILQVTTLAVATMFAAGTATGLAWLLLRATFHLMRPATAQRLAVRSTLVRGTMQVARAFDSRS